MGTKVGCVTGRRDIPTAKVAFIRVKRKEEIEAAFPCQYRYMVTTTSRGMAVCEIPVLRGGANA